MGRIVDIEKLQQMLKDCNKVNQNYREENLAPLGLCAIIELLRIRGEIEEGSYKDIKREIKSYARLQDHQFTYYGDKIQDISKFVWKPYDFESRNEFLENLKKRYIE